VVSLALVDRGTDSDDIEVEQDEDAEETPSE
jgi:hypothetical protein